MPAHAGDSEVAQIRARGIARDQGMTGVWLFKGASRVLTISYVHERFIWFTKQDILRLVWHIHTLSPQLMSVTARCATWGGGAFFGLLLFAFDWIFRCLCVRLVSSLYGKLFAYLRQSLAMGSGNKPVPRHPAMGRLIPAPQAKVS